MSLKQIISLAHDARLRLHVLRRAPKVLADWRRLISVPIEVRAVDRIRRVVIVPSDPGTLTGAKGDEAMMNAAVNRLRDAEPGLVVGVLTATKQAEDAARALDFQPIPVWTHPWDLNHVNAAIDEFCPDGMLIVGADVMDGYYNPVTAIQMLVVADISARKGVKTAILGFSFNKKPSPYLKEVFDGASPTLNINVRDKISLGRFKKFSSTSANLVADIAFLLVPEIESTRVGAIQVWADSRRVLGDAVIGFNMHPMLIRKASAAQVTELVDSAVRSLSEVMEARSVSVLLLSHDYRGADGDDSCLSVIFSKLADRFPGRLCYPTEHMRAAELKAITGSLDGVVTGRMHLAIASLGMGVPVAALTYQDKFQGLFEHFNLDTDFLLPPEGVADPEVLRPMIDKFISSIDLLKAQVTERKADVMRLSQANMNGLVT